MANGSGFADQVLNKLVKGTAEIMGDNLCGVYLHGSYAMGCFNPAKSDLDVIIVTDRCLTDACRREYMDMIVGLDASFPTEGAAGARHSGIEMSVVLKRVCDPFVYPTPYELHFSRAHLAWYRKDPDDYIRRMRGTDRDLAAHFTVIRARGKCLWGPPVGAVFGDVPREAYLDSIMNDVAAAREEIAGNPMYLTLNLARVLAFQTEGAVLSKKEGGEWALRNLPRTFHPLIRTALDDYGSDEAVRYDPRQTERYAQFMLGRIGIAEGSESPEGGETGKSS